MFIDFGSIIVPFIFSFHKKLNFYKYWKPFFISNTIVTILFIIWDIIFTAKGVWGFNPKYLTGLYLYNLPIEEILFFICIPYASLFTYHSLGLIVNQKFQIKTMFTIFFVLVLLLFAFLNLNRLYTSTTFFLLAVFLTLVIWKNKNSWLTQFYFTYLIILIPFFIVNGILTGSWINEPVVWYNNNENLTIRLLTIPLEDVFYGLLLLLMNTYLYEYFKQKKSTI